MPLLSICIPTYNRAPFLRECLNSIIISMNGYEHEIEIVISNNASIDNTSDVVEEFQKSYPWIRYHCNDENVGDKNFYIVSTLASGKYVWLIGDDDKITPQAIPTIIKQIRHDYSMIITNYSILSKDMSIVKRLGNLPPKENQLFINHNELLECFGIHLGFISIIIIKKDLLFKPSYAEHEFYAKYGFGFLYTIYLNIIANCHVLYLAEPLVHNRSDNSFIDTATWDRNFVTGSFLVFDALALKGYSNKSILGAKNGLLKDFIFWTILGRVRNRENTYDLFKKLLPLYKKNYFFWFACVPALLTPPILLKIATQLIRRSRNQP